MSKTEKPSIRFHGFDDTWEQRKLGDNIAEYTEKTTINNQYPVLTSSRRGIFFQTDYYDGNQIASADNTGYNIVPYGYFTYRHMSDDEIFHFNINDITENGIVSTLYPVFTTDENLDSRYLQYQLNYGKEFAKYAVLQKQGGSRTYMYLNKLKELRLTIPNFVEEQKKISAYFMKLDNFITLHQRKFEKLTNVKKSMLEKMFPQNGSCYPAVRFKGFTGPWERRKFGDVFEEYSEKNRADLPPLTIIQGSGTIRRDESERALQYDKASLSNYRKPYTMQRNIEEAFKLYSGDRPLGLFADKLEHNLEKMNALYDDIGSIFRSAGIENFEKLPVDHTERGQFAKLFKQLNSYLEAAKIQGFTWNKLSYEFKNVGRKVIINLHLDETTYLILALRYKELFASGSGEAGVEDVPYEIDSYLTEINTGVIDANYMNSRFKKYIKALQDGTETAAVLDELHKSFATLTQEEQKYANIFLHDVQNGDVIVDEGKTLRNYITEYMTSAKNDQIHRFATAIGVDETILRSFMQSKITEANINEFGKFDTLKATVDTEKAKTFLEMIEGKPIKKFQINMKIDQMLRRFILEGGFDIT